jgi:hypothetical protein
VASEHTTRNRRRLLVVLVAVASGLALVLGLVVLTGDDTEVVSVESTPTTEPTSTTEPTRTESTRTESTTTPTSDDLDTGDGDERTPQAVSTQDCRVDPACPSSEHRTSDPCGATLIVDAAGYDEGRRDAEQGLANQIDHAPAPGPADEDDDDGTVGPETRYRAGYAQGWCDGGGVDPNPG